MGFSLKRALAGAIVGGAQAVGQIADARLREVEQDRVREENFARQQQLMQMQEEVAMRREQRVAEMKEVAEENKAKRIGGFMKDGVAKLRKEGLDPGSAAGQRRLAELALENNQPALGDKFFDNAIRIDQIEGQTELRKAEIAARAEVARLSRDGRGSRVSDEDKDYEKGFTYAGQAGARIMVPDREGKLVKFDNGPGYLQGLFTEAIDNGMTAKEARRLVNDTQVAISRGVKAAPGNPDGVALDAINHVRARMWAPVKEAPSSAAPSVPTPAPAPKPYTQSVFGSQSNRSGQNTGLLGKIPNEGNFR